MKIIVFCILFVILSPSFQPVRSPACEGQAEHPSERIREKPPFKLILLKGVSWADRCEGYDPDLPGYHLSGAVGRIQIQPRLEKLPLQLVFEIQTSSDLPPMLEEFKMVCEDTTLAVVPFNEDDSVLLRVRGKKDTTEIMKRMPQRNFFRFERSDDVVRVIFEAEAMKFLKHPCHIQWVDWFRK